MSIGTRLEQQGRHPVLIFGAASSGKSSLILSLLNALGNAEEVNVLFSDNEPILDDADGEAQLRAHATARQFFDWGLYRWSAGEPPLPNAGDRFFIPIAIEPRYGDRPAVKLAILDGRGEDYGPKLPTDRENIAPIGELRRPLGDEIKQLLKEYSHEITVIYIAPCSREDTIDANTGLRHLIQEYSTARVPELRENDSHLFLFTKWDDYADPLSNRRMFESPSPIEVLKQIRPRYESAWGQFCGLSLGKEVADRRTFMQYSAGYFVDGKLDTPPDLVSEVFKRYPRTVANWLYARAAKSNLTQRKIEIENTLDVFLDVRFENKRTSLSDRIITLILSDVTL